VKLETFLEHIKRISSSVSKEQGNVRAGPGFNYNLSRIP
jgi:hypothetical protein